MSVGYLDDATVLTLLRRFEPVIRSTKGDKFFPMDCEPYVRACSLWVQRPGEEAVCAVPGGKLSLENLAQQPLDEAGAVHFLKFTDPEDLPKRGSRGAGLSVFRQRAARGLKESREAFRAGRGRLARVGYFSRFVDALYSITLLARGRVPGESAAAAATAYERIMAEEERYTYHGRVLRQDGWLVLQYWLFYPFNDWRSGFFGANDHEADWEKVMIFLSEPESGDVRPEWVAYASHNYSGDNLRRRWDDPEVVKVGEHPVIYVGAGSHASYYAQGEYLTELTLPLPRPLARASRAARGFWRKRLGQYSGNGDEGGGLLPRPLRGLLPRRRPDDRGGGREGLEPPEGHNRIPPQRGSAATGAFGGSTPGTPSRARTRPPAPCTTATRPWRGYGTTRWAGPGSTRCPRPRRRSRPSASNGRISRSGARRCAARSRRRAASSSASA